MANIMNDASQLPSMSDDEDDEEIIDDYRGKTGVMFLIDFRKNMFKNNDSNCSHFRKSIEACKEILRHVARSGRDDLIGIYLFGTVKGNVERFPMVVEVQPLSSSSAERIKGLDQIIVDKGDLLLKEHEQMEASIPIQFSKILNFAQKVFFDCPKKIYIKTAVIISNDDDPCQSDNNLSHLSRKEANKLKSANIELNVIGVGEDFDSKKFYNELIYISRGEFTTDYMSVDKVKQLSSLESQLKSVMSRLSRTYRRLYLSDSIYLSVALFSLYKEPTYKIKNTAIVKSTADSQTLQPATSTDQKQPTTSTDENERPRPSSHEPYIQIFEKRDQYPVVMGHVIKLSKDTLDSQMARTGVGLTLIGFMPTRNIPEYLTVGVPKIMLPDYKNKDGTEAFYALYASCFEKEVSMLCWYMYNKRALPKMVACHPMTEQVNSTGNVCPPGFCIVDVPFDDDYTDPDDYVLEGKPSQTQTLAAEKIVKKMTSKYYPSSFHDHEYQKFLAVTEALALDFDSAEQIEDDTDINVEAITEMLGNLSEELTTCSFTDMKQSRSANDSDGPPSKMKKTFSDEEALQLLKSGKGNLLTVAQLKNLMDSLGHYYPNSAKKTDLIDLAHKYFVK